jgi:hypothetical protein
MNLKDHPIIVAVTLVFTVISLVIAAAAAAWKSGIDTSENRVKALEAQINVHELSDKLHLPELLNDLREASKQLGASLESTREIAALRKEVDEAKNREENLNQQFKLLQEEKAQIQSKLQESQKIVKSLYVEVQTFSLKENSTQSLLGYEIAVGLQSVLLGNVIVFFDQKQVTMQAGQELTATRMGKTCILRLDSTHFDSADFTFIVKQ